MGGPWHPCSSPSLRTESSAGADAFAGTEPDAGTGAAAGAG